MARRHDAPDQRRNDSRLHERHRLRTGSAGSMGVIVVDRVGGGPCGDRCGGNGMERSLAVGARPIVR
jgi:hypothetical protein